MTLLINDPIHPDTPIDTNVDVSTGVEYTPNYNLILNTRNSISSWLTVVNTNMSKIDMALHNLELRTSIDGEVPPEAIEDIIELNEQVSQLVAKVTEHSNKLSYLATKVDDHETRITANYGDIQTLKQNYINVDQRMTTAERRITALESSVTKLQTNATA